MDDGIYRLRGIVYLIDGIMEESQIFFRINLVFYFIYYDVGCKVNFKKGYVVIMEFFIFCDGWYDDDLFFSYEFRYVELFYNLVDFEFNLGKLLIFCLNFG